MLVTLRYTKVAEVNLFLILLPPTSTLTTVLLPPAADLDALLTLDTGALPAPPAAVGGSSSSRPLGGARGAVGHVDTHLVRVGVGVRVRVRVRVRVGVRVRVRVRVRVELERAVVSQCVGRGRQSLGGAQAQPEQQPPPIGVKAHLAKVRVKVRGWGRGLS